MAHAAMKLITPASGSQRRHPVLRSGEDSAADGEEGGGNAADGGEGEEGCEAADGGADEGGGGGEKGGADEGGTGRSGDPPGATSAMQPA